MKVKFTNDGPAESLECRGCPVSGNKMEGYTAEDSDLYACGYRWMTGGEAWRGDPASSCLARPRTDATPILPVVAPDATTEPVSNSYKFEWRKLGHRHVLFLDGEKVGEIAPPTRHMNYYWQAGETRGRCFCLADAQYAVRQAVKVNIELGNMVED